MADKRIKSHAFGGFVVQIMDTGKDNRSHPETRYYAVMRRTGKKAKLPAPFESVSLKDLHVIERLAKLAHDTILTQLCWTIQPD